jgi:hypothetical protein
MENLFDLAILNRGVSFFNTAALKLAVRRLSPRWLKSPAAELLENATKNLKLMGYDP